MSDVHLVAYALTGTVALATMVGAACVSLRGDNRIFAIVLALSMWAVLVSPAILAIIYRTLVEAIGGSP